MLNNSFEDNGSHGTGVVAIEAMPNVEISGDNVFSSNTDSVDFNAAVLYQFIDNGYYLKEYLDSEEYAECWSTINLIENTNTLVSHLTIKNSSCDCTRLVTASGETAGLQFRHPRGTLSVSNVDISGNTCQN